MTVLVISAAKHIAKRSGWALSNLELQKILYIAHMFHLGRTNGQPLVYGSFESWDYGPVHPDLYHKVKVFGSDPVQNVFHDTQDIENCPERDILDEAFDNFGNAGHGKLVSATHRFGGAWDLNYMRGAKHCLIPNEDILNEYERLGNGLL